MFKFYTNYFKSIMSSKIPRKINSYLIARYLNHLDLSFLCHKKLTNLPICCVAGNGLAWLDLVCLYNGLLHIRRLFNLLKMLIIFQKKNPSLELIKRWGLSCHFLFHRKKKKMENMVYITEEVNPVFVGAIIGILSLVALVVLGGTCQNSAKQPLTK